MVKTTEAFSVYWNYQVWHLAKGEEVTGGLADYLLATGSPVEDLGATPEAYGAVDDEPDEPEGGTVSQIREWVGEDRERAAQALAAEQSKGDAARSTLVASLEKLLSDD